MKIEKATILLCTYNAQKYIYEQLTSLVNQTYPNLEILIYDDLSTDDTLSIIRKFMMQHEDKVLLKVAEKNSGSAKNNFLKALKENMEKKYIFFSDQDDIWDIKKVEIMMNKMIQLESSESKPYMICHNCNIVNKNGDMLSKKAIRNVAFEHLIFHPEIQGCCMLVNNKAIRGLQIKNDLIEMHDWILSLYVALIGDIVVIDKELIDYRQHENNQVGYKKYNLFQRFKLLKNVKQKKEKFESVLRQVYLISMVVNTEFLNRYQKCYIKKNGIGIITLFFEHGVINVNLHGIYQSFMIVLAVTCRKF